MNYLAFINHSLIIWEDAKGVHKSFAVRDYEFQYVIGWVRNRGRPLYVVRVKARKLCMAVLEQSKTV